MMFKFNMFGYVTILIILSLSMATNDGEMLFHFADSNLYYCYLYTTYSTFVLHILTVKVDIYHSYMHFNLISSFYF